MDFKVKCVGYKAKECNFTVGKIYDVHNGCITADCGYEYHAWAFSSNGDADFEALKKWFDGYYDFELVEDKKMFTKSDLKTGMFGVMTWFTGELKSNFVVVNDLIVYEDGGFDTFESLDDDLEYFEWHISKVYTGCCSFQNLNSNIDGYTSNATLVYDRERDTKKPLYNGKVVCVDLCGHNSTSYTVGKIYQFENGVLTDDRGTRFGGEPGEEFYTFEDWARWTGSKFIEVVE